MTLFPERERKRLHSKKLVEANLSRLVLFISLHRFFGLPHVFTFHKVDLTLMS